MKKPWRDARFIVGGGTLALILLLSVLQPLLPLRNPDVMHVSDRLASPSTQYLLGTDEFGRDLLSRLVVGTRTSLVVALASVTLAALGGIAIVIVSGYSKIGEMLVMRFVDLLLIFPPIVLAIAVIGFFGRSILNLVFVIAVLYTPVFARLAYGSAKAIREEVFVEAAQAIGASKTRITRKQVLPNILSPLIVQFSLSTAAAILLESGLSFLGLGVKPPTASLGKMIASGRGYMYLDPLYVLWPALLLSIIILCLNLLGDALRDYLDPRIQRTISH